MPCTLSSLKLCASGETAEGVASKHKPQYASIGRRCSFAILLAYGHGLREYTLEGRTRSKKETPTNSTSNRRPGLELHFGLHGANLFGEVLIPGTKHPGRSRANAQSSEPRLECCEELPEAGSRTAVKAQCPPAPIWQLGCM